jgi:hypothetical protein
MRDDPLLCLLMDLRDAQAPEIPGDVVSRIYEIEQRVQFDDKRPDAPEDIRQVVETALDREELNEIKELNNEV